MIEMGGCRNPKIEKMFARTFMQRGRSDAGELREYRTGRLVRQAVTRQIDTPIESVDETLDRACSEAGFGDNIQYEVFLDGIECIVSISAGLSNSEPAKTESQICTVLFRR